VPLDEKAGNIELGSQKTYQYVASGPFVQERARQTQVMDARLAVPLKLSE